MLLKAGVYGLQRDAAHEAHTQEHPRPSIGPLYGSVVLIAQLRIASHLLGAVLSGAHGPCLVVRAKGNHRAVARHHHILTQLKPCMREGQGQDGGGG